MTNNPTIDGVSREVLELVLTYGCSTDASKEALEKLRALLDAPVTCICRGCFTEQPSGTACVTCAKVESERSAPVVERQPVAYDFNPTQYARNFIDSDMPPGKYIAVEHYAALQSTIAQLQARVEYLELELSGVENAKSQLAEKLGCDDEPRWKWMLIAADTLKSRAQELESGRGDVARYERWYQGSWFEVHAGDVARFEKDGWKIRRLYAAPPAPVAVIDENAAFENWAGWHYGLSGNEELNLSNAEVRANKVGWLARSCLDATAALNGERK